MIIIFQEGNVLLILNQKLMIFIVEYKYDVFFLSPTIYLNPVMFDEGSIVDK